MLSVVRSGGVIGIEGYVVDVEVNLANGLPQFITVGLPDTAVKESRERVRAAIESVGFKFPLKRITVNLAPADMMKIGTLYDLPIAVGILKSTKVIKEENLSKTAFVGELALNGELRKVRGILPIVIKLKDEGFERIVLPVDNQQEASIISGIDVYGFRNLREIVDFLNGEMEKSPVKTDINDSYFQVDHSSYGDFSEVRGQYTVKRALEIAAAGRHNVLLIGSPGAGKTMAVKRLPSILPPLSVEEAIEITKIHSISGILKDSIIRERPFRQVHHTASDVSLIGGGTFPKPGEVSLAHLGILFLDELPEFSRKTLEVLRQPLEDREITISRANSKVRFPANFQLVATANPCPCGFRFDPKKECRCTPVEIKRYLGKISGPLLDRIDLSVTVMPVDPSELSNKPTGEPSASIRERVIKAVQIQKERFEAEPINYNSEMSPSHIEKYAKLSKQAVETLNTAATKISLSARSYHRVIKVARTIADLNGEEEILPNHVIEAIRYKVNDNLG